MDTSKPSDLRPVPLARPGAVVLQGPLTRPQVLNATPDALSLLKALRRRWALAVGLGLLAAATLGPAAWYVVPRAKYTAVSTLHVATKPKRIIFDPKDSLADYHTYQRTQIAYIKDRKILGNALSKEEVALLRTVKEHVDAEEWLAENLRVEFPGGSEILSISLSGDRPEDLATIVNAVVDSYMGLVVGEEKRAQNERLGKLTKLLSGYQERLELQRKALKELAGEVGGSDRTAVSLAQQFKVQNLGVVRAELLEAQSEILKGEARIAALKSRPAPAGVAATRPNESQELEQHPEVVRQRELVGRLGQHYRSVSAIARQASDAAVQRARRDWEEANRALDGLRKRVGAELVGRRREAAVAPGAGPADLEGWKEHVATWTAYRDAMKKQADQLQEDMQETGQGGVELESRQESLSIAADVSRKVGSEVEAVQVEMDAPDRISLLSKANPPRTRDEMKKIKAGVGAALGAFTFALLGVSFWEFRSRRVDAPDELVTGLGMRLVGSLPPLPTRARRRPGAAGLPDRRWQNLLVEAVDSARTMLLHASRTEALRVVMVTSAVKGEGKTSLACHLAASLARAGRRVLLVDCDLRSPAAHRLFDIDPAPGLCELLRGEVEAAGVIRETVTGGLDLLPAGRSDALALQAIAQDGIRGVFDELRRAYDFIIVDSAPVLPLADSLQISQSVDGVILSVLRDVSRLPQVYTAYERLLGLGAKILGAIVSGVPSETYEPYHQAEQHAGR